MLLAVDIGNSSVDLGVFLPDGTLRMRSKAAAEKKRSGDEYAVVLQGLLQLYGIQPSELTACILSSVVPTLTVTVSSAIRKLCGLTPYEVGPGTKTGLNIKIESQTELGADLVANAVATLAAVKPPCVIVDAGSVTTFTAIDSDGVLQGVNIAPGLRMSLDALSAGAAELPTVPIVPSKRLVGKNSRESMNIGVLRGHAFLTDGFVSQLRDALGDNCRALITGGLAQTLLPYCKEPLEYMPDLTLNGLHLLYRKNEKLLQNRKQ